MALTDNQRTILGMMIDAYDGDKTSYRLQLRDSDDFAISEIAVYTAKRIPEVQTDIQVCTDKLTASQQLLALLGG